MQTSVDTQHLCRQSTPVQCWNSYLNPIEQVGMVTHSISIILFSVEVLWVHVDMDPLLSRLTPTLSATESICLVQIQHITPHDLHLSTLNSSEMQQSLVSCSCQITP